MLMYCGISYILKNCIVNKQEMQYFLKDRKSIKLRDTHAFFAHNLKRIVLKKNIILNNFTSFFKDFKSKNGNIAKMMAEM